jgi:hypothetical protein
MAITFTPLPYGMRDVKIYPLSSLDVPAGTGIDLPNSRTMQFAEAEAFTDLRGADSLVATHGNGPEVNWTIDGGGVSLEIVKAIYGGTIVETGVTPSGVKTITKTKTDVRPYFQAIGQAISDSGGDFWITIYKCKATGDLSVNLQEGQFTLTNTKGKGLANSSGNLWAFVQHETATALA